MNEPVGLTCMAAEPNVPEDTEILMGHCKSPCMAQVIMISLFCVGALIGGTKSERNECFGGLGFANIICLVTNTWSFTIEDFRKEIIYEHSRRN